MSAYARSYLLVLLFVLLSSPAQGQTAAQPAPSVIGSRAEIMTWSDPLEALGTLRADESVTLSATVTDIVAEINFEDGAQVEQGQVLIRLDDAEEQAQLRSAQAISDERSNTLGRTIQLQERNLAARADLEDFQAQLRQAQANTQVIEARLTNYQIKAPFSGRVGLRTLTWNW